MKKKVTIMHEHHIQESEFEAIKCLATLSEERWQMAYAILVKGEKMKEVADRHGYSRQNINGLINTVLGWQQKYQAAKETERKLEGL